MGILLIIAISLVSSVFVNAEENLRVIFYDVGQGDAIHIRSKNQDILIDGGPDGTIISKLDANLPFYDQEIELMILTHPHADHIAGLVPVLEKYQVDQILYSGIDYDSNVYEEWKRIVEEQDIPLLEARQGQIIKLNEASMFILFPGSQEIDKENINNSSVVSKLVYGESTFLFTGDAEKEVENELLASDINLEAEVLKVGHHGSKTASTKDFLAQVSPMYAVISAGKDNKFGHPHEETLEKFINLETNILRTDVSGDIKCISDKKEIKCN